MSYFITYCDNWQRVISACIIDNRANIPEIKNKDGFTIKAYIDSQLALVTENVLVYRVESENCNLAGFFALKREGSDIPVQKIMQVLRPASQGIEEISLEINNFIVSGNWQYDLLTTN